MRQRARGQAIIEFALVSILFFTLLFGILDFGMLLNDWVSATTAASVGARQAAVGACFDGSASDPTTCPTQNHTSVIGAVMESAPLLAADGNCQNPPGAGFRCINHVDIALVNTNLQQALCEDVELWQSARTVQSGSTSTVIRTSSTGWPTNSLVGSVLTFTSGANDNMSETITANTATTITVASAFPNTPAAGTTFDVTARTFQPITSGWLTSCALAPPDPQINDTLSVVVRAQIQLPIAFPPLSPDMQVQSSSTVRFEGDFVS